MPRIFDNIDQRLLDALQHTLKISDRADFCVGYFNLRGWRTIDSPMEGWQGNEQGRCRLLIGMQEKPEDELRKIFSLKSGQEIDQGTIVRLKARMAQEFREQLLVGAPSNADEEGLRRLSRELRSGKLVVKLFLRHKLHAKLYLFYQQSNPITHSDFWKNISAYLLGPNFNVMPTVLIPAQFKANSIGIPPLVDVDGTHTLLVTLGYAIIFAVVAVVLTW